MAAKAAAQGSEGKGEATPYTLRYFNWRGKAEVARLLFALAGQPFLDVRLPHDHWPAYRPQTPFGQLPVLEIDGEVHAQSVSIANFLAREFGLYGQGNREMLRVDEVVGLQQELMALAVKLYYTQDPQAKARLARELKDEIYPRYCGHFEKLLKQTDSGYFVGTSLTMADLAAYDILQGPLEENPSLLRAFPLLAENRRLVESNPRLAKYLQSRPVTEC